MVLTARSRRCSPTGSQFKPHSRTLLLQLQSACSGWAPRDRCRRLRKCRHSFVLSQRRLQIESEISRLFRRDRPVHAKNFAPENMVRGTIDRLDADELSGLVAKRRERSLRAIAAHYDAVVAGGQACDLELVVALVAPEPRQAVIRLRIAGEPRRDAARVIGGVLHRLKPQRAAKARACEQRAVA